MGKTDRKRKRKSDTKLDLQRPTVDTDKKELGVADKLSRIFYGWMKKRKSSAYLTLKAEEFDIRGLICEGAFGKVLMAVNTNTGLTAAAKIEPMNTRCPQLLLEYKLYEKMGCDTPGFIKIYHYGPCIKAAYNVLVMELLGPDLDDLFVCCDERFTHKTVLMIAIQTLHIMEHVHNCNIVYRDIKPENFCIGHRYQNKERIIHIIDFGLSKAAEQPTPEKNANEIVYDYLIGTARYMSVNAHFALEQSQRDDLESLGYMYVYFLKGRLPWMGLSKVWSVSDHYQNIAKIKASSTPEDLIGEYSEFVEYIKYVKNLEHMEVPDYNYLIGLMKNMMSKKGYKNDGIFDWSAIMNQKYLNKALDVDPDD